jgi:hypothetical protein
MAAYVKVMQYLLSPTRQQMEIDNSAAHVKYFATVLRLAIAVDAQAFAQADKADYLCPVLGKRGVEID